MIPDSAACVSFRPLCAEDLGLMHRWLNEEHVERWWREGGSLQKVEEEYLPLISEQNPVRPFIVLHGNLPIGYIQSYPISHDEEYARLVGVEGSGGVDLFIGEAESVHRGLGPRILWRFLEEIIFADGEVEVCVIGPEPENRAAIRAYEKVGFRYFKTIHVPGEPQPEHLMKVFREELE